MGQGQVKIISGALGGRFLNFPLVGGIRPTSAKTRASIFSALQSRLDLEGAHVLDLFCGSGALGIESLSRGAEFVTFVEKQKELTMALRRNIKSLALETKSEIIESDAVRFLQRPVARKFDVVFADPPYMMGFSEELPKLLVEQDLLNQGALFFLECGKREMVTARELLQGKLGMVFERISGDTKLFLFQRINEGGG